MDNLERFRSEIKALTKAEGPSKKKFEKSHGLKTTFLSPKLSRKQKRKEDRQQKKERKNAYSRRLPIPTKEDIEKAKEDKLMAEKLEKKKKKLKAMKKKSKKRLARKKKEAQEAEQEEKKVETMWDDKEIKDLEKKLGLNKRKKKDTLPQSFMNDGLDYILDVVDPQKLQSLAEYNQLEGDSDNEFAGLQEDSESDEAEHMDMEQFYSDDDHGDDVDDGNDHDSDGDNDVQVFSDTVDKSIQDIKSKSKKELTQELDIGENIDKIQKSAIGGKEVAADKKEKWEELAEKIKEITAKKLKEKKGKKDKKVRFEELGDGSGDDADAVEEMEDDSEFENTFESDDDSINEGEEIEDDLDAEDDEVDMAHIGMIKGTKRELEDSDSEGDNLAIDLEYGPEGDNEADTNEENNELKEDIYGRLKDSSGKIVRDNKPAGGEGAYVPPGKRLQMARGMDEKRKLKLEKLHKQLKGMVNRVSEANMQPISSQIEELYLGNSRADVSDTLVEFVRSSCVTVALTPDRLSMELMMLVAILHGNVGSEVGAAFLQELVKVFNSLSMEVNYGAGKQMDNVMVLLAHLYNFKVVDSVLIFNLLDRLTESFQEKDIELILLLLKHVGFTLRKDSPSELKDFIVKVQAKASGEEGGKLADQSRVRFMLEVIMAIRNNNMRKIPNYDPDHLDHLRKLIKTYIRGGHFGDNQLHVSVNDLLNAEQKGKWWLVGSSWDGKDSKHAENGDSKSSSSLGNMEVSNKLQQLARKQRMNTELRRNIFYIIMTSEDYIDAFEKLLRQGLKSSQQQEMVLVILSCCMQEKQYNPFYAYLAQKFCEYHRTYQMGFQFSLWDQFKVLGSLLDRSRDQLAKLLAHLVSTGALSLSVFKTVQFGTLDKAMVRFMKHFMTELLLEHPDDNVKEVFTRIAHIDKLKPLHEGLKLFLKHFLVKGKKSEPKSPMLIERVEMVERILTRGKGHVLL
ncbi:nucleolar MIF4G domain-containing protein 1-like [Mya arenaria]|uniref:nucleolar MIF4G domain-containing protein 1-like n=1 Tax=Mya arenaria TaxID=6604 RepID=UPI0022E5818E|nr:nucleolar MIF4G domain-containing protein 1-like [Mya arenaria]